MSEGADKWEVEEEDRAVRKSRLDRLLDQVGHNHYLRSLSMMVFVIFFQALKANCDVPLAKMVLALRFRSD